MTIKLILASYFEEENHGLGRKIGVSPGRPSNVECDLVYPNLSPSSDAYFDYHKNKKNNYKEAGEIFVKLYKDRLNDFVKEARRVSEKNGKSIFETIQLKDGDTLLTWERKGNTSYRILLAEALKDLGYDVVEN